MTRYYKQNRIIDCIHLLNVRIQYRLASIFHDDDWLYTLNEGIYYKRKCLDSIAKPYVKKMKRYICLSDSGMPTYRRNRYVRLSNEYEMLLETIRDYKRLELSL